MLEIHHCGPEPSIYCRALLSLHRYIWYCYVYAGSPFTQNIGEGALPSAHGTGLYRGEEDKSAVFYIDSRGMKGEPTVQVDG